jgi:imidazolonepropionase
MLLINATLAAMDGSPAYGLVEQGAVAIEKGLIAWVGRDDAIPAQLKAGEVIDLEGRLVTPALIDCHTHVVHGGNRAREFEMRLEGASYEEIARPAAVSSRLSPPRAPPRRMNLLLRRAARVDALIAEGVSTIEIKSGYGLDIDNELKMLRVPALSPKGGPVRVRTSFLGAHAVPPEYRGRPDAYIDGVCLPALEAAMPKDWSMRSTVSARASPSARSRSRRCSTRPGAGLPVKLHAEQLSNLGGTSAGSRIRRAVRRSSSNMPRRRCGSHGESRHVWPSPARRLLHAARDSCSANPGVPRAGVPMAVATDCNPGSSPMSRCCWR